jgi:hypothetical protein
MTSKAFGLAQLGNAYSDGALSNRSKIINGAMTIDQRNAGAAVSANGAYPTDRWQLGISGGTWSVQQSSTAPAGFSKSTAITISTGYSKSVSDQNNFRQFVEGQNVYDLGWGASGAQSVTLSFWVRSSLTGTFAGSLINSAYDRSYVFTYSISAADTWEYKTVIIAGDTSGTWLTTNGVGIRLFFDLGSGSNSETTAGAWTAGEYRRVSGAVDVVATTGATFYITGVQLEAGDTATPFEHRSYGAELALCERYYLRQQGSTLYPFFCTGYLNSATRMFGIFNFPQKMRTTPTLETGTVSNYQILSVTASPTCTGISLDGQTTNFSAFLVIDASAGGMTTGQGSIFRGNNTASAFVAYSAEL